MIIGIDEVGRGAWAGPLVVGAVALNVETLGLKDSKLLSKKTREQLAGTIEQNADFIGIGWVRPEEIDALGLTAALGLGCQRAVMGAPDLEIIIDGNINFLSSNPKSRCMIKADALVQAVSAASIIAKVARDTYMAEQAVHIPGYGFETHVGYGTKRHLLALQKLGITPLHRKSFKPVKVFL